MPFKPIRIVIAAALTALAGCAATVPPQELLDARQAFLRASTGAAARYSPADLEGARQALARAEQAFADAPDADSTRDFAYLAAVKAYTAEAKGRSTENELARAAADREYKAL